MNATDAAAWIGAITGTLALFWEIFVWAKTGPRIEVSASPNMEAIGALAGIIGKEPCGVVEARNVGDGKTTITHVVGFYYESWLQWFCRRRPTRTLFVPDPTPGRLPHVLDAGERWLGMMEQNDDLIEMSQKGRLYCGVLHSTSSKPAVARVVIRKPQKTQQGAPADGPASRARV